MSTLCFAENPVALEELSLLSSEIAASLPRLRLGNVTRLGGFRLSCVRHDKNVVYRVAGKADWYLKIPGRLADVVVGRELLGAEASYQALRALPVCLFPSYVSADVENGYLLASRVRAQQLNHVLYWSSVTSLWFDRGRTQAAFRNLGTALGHLHGTEAGRVPGDRSNRRLPGEDGKVLLKAPRPWEEALVHGNLRMDNVLTADGRVCMVDFENCGHGSIYDDLSIICSQLLLVRTLMAFPWRHATAAMQAFLQGYESIHRCDPHWLGRHVSERVRRFELKARRNRLAEGRIAAMPVLLSKVRRLRAVLDREPSLAGDTPW